MIPKKIHYFWFGKGKKSKLSDFCIESWKKIQPDFEMIEWNEDSFDVTSNVYIKQAYEQKKWAFVSDYARAKILFEQGGFYLDTDMELRMPLNEFTKHRAICGFEIKGIPFSAFWGVEAGHPLAKDIKEYYEKQTSFKEIPNTEIFSKLLTEKYGAVPESDHFQELKEGIVLYPSHYFSLDLPKNFVVHHFSGSWHGAWSEEENAYKNFVNTYGIIKMFSEIPNGKREIKNLILNKKVFSKEEILDQIPLEYLVSYVKGKVLKKLKP